MKKIIAVLLLSVSTALAQTHTLTGNNVVPSGSSLNIISGASLLGTWNYTGVTVTNFPTLNQNTTGSAATLTTPRTINGVSFNGSANIIAPSIGATGKIVQTADGVNWTASTPLYPTAVGTAGYNFRSDGSTGFATYPMQITNANTSDNTGFAADQYLTGSACVTAVGDMKAKGQYRCVFDMTKTGAGVAAPVITVRVGTTGSTSDTTATIVFTFGVGTGVIDTGTFEVDVVWRSVGSGTSAVLAGICRAQHNLATTGLFSNADAWTIIGTTTSGFNSSAVTTIGVSFNGGSLFAGTNKVVQATLQQ
jgi:hypothetical protein